MRSVARFAFGNARVHAMKSRLRTPMPVAPRRRPFPVGAPRTSPEALFEDLLACYRAVVRSYPRGGELFGALLRLHEIENLKLAWRSRILSVSPERWTPLWRCLGRLQTLDPEPWRAGKTDRALLASLEGSVWQHLVETALFSAGADPAGIEITWDRWASRELVRLARLLPKEERDSCRIVLSLVRERDLQLVRRGIPSYGLTPSAVVEGTALLAEELGRDAVERLSRWAPGDPPLELRMFRGLGLSFPAADWPALELSMRRLRRSMCRRTFSSSPFRIAPAIAFLLLKEEESRSVLAIEETEIEGAAQRALELALAAGPLER